MATATGLKSLTFTALPAKIGVGANPVQDRRAMVIKRLEEQKTLLADPNFTRTINVMVKNEAGVKTKQQKTQKVYPWWSQAANGSCVLVVRFGYQPVGFDKGKSAISVPSLEQLPAVIDTLIGAIRAGELDKPLAQAAELVKKSLARKGTKKAS